MGLNHKNIHDLLNRFWDGETTLEEEAALKEFFRYNTAPEGQEDVAAYFNMLSEEEEVLSADFDERILEQLTEGKTRRMIQFNWRVAAAVLALLGLSYVFVTQDKPEDQLANLTPVNTEDPEVQQAFEQTKSALFMISDRLNKGSEHTNKLTKFHDAQIAIKSKEK